MNTVTEVNEFLKTTSPFGRPYVVKNKDIWSGDRFPDLEILNAHASNMVMEALEALRTDVYDATSILIIADNGSGKSHLISRLRKKIRLQKSGLFLVISDIAENLSHPQKALQSFLSGSLAQQGGLPVTQWQELAADIFNTVWRTSKLGYLEPEQLVDFFNDKIRRANKLAESVESTTSRYCRLNPEVSDSDVIRAILWTLVQGEASLNAVKWLAGQELSAYKANLLRLPCSNECFVTVLEILKIISFHKELIMCFDELDNLEVDDNGNYKASVVCGLIKNLFNHLHKGIIVTFMDTITWRERVKKQTSQSTWQRIQTYGDPIILRSLNEDLSFSLLKIYLQKFYQSYNIIPPTEIYPFVETEVRFIGSQRLSVRKFLEWCEKRYKEFIEEISNIKIIKDSKCQKAFESELESVSDQIMDQDSLIASVLFNKFKALIGYTIEKVTIEGVEEKVVETARGRKDPYINFKIVGTDQGKLISIGVSVTQTDSGHTLGAYFRRLVNPEKYKINLTRACLVRSKQKSISTPNRNTYLIPLTEQLGGEFVDLKFEEVKPLIALHRVYQKRDTDYELTEEEIKEFVSQKGSEFLLGEHNPLIKEILSDPSGQAPDLETEPEVQELDTSASSDDDDDADIDSFFSN